MVDTLDEVAFGAGAEYVKARAACASCRRSAILAEPRPRRWRSVRYQSRHADLFRQMQNDELAPRDLRMARWCAIHSPRRAGRSIADFSEVVGSRCSVFSSGHPNSLTTEYFLVTEREGQRSAPAPGRPARRWRRSEWAPDTKARGQGFPAGNSPRRRPARWAAPAPSCTT